MPRGELDAAEALAGEIVAKRVGGRAIPTDIEGAPDATPDFNIELADRATFPLEVTSAGDDALESLHVAGFRPVHAAPNLSSDWWIGLPNEGEVRVKQVMRGAAPHLAVLEEHGVDEVGHVAVALRKPLSGIDEAAADASRALFALGVYFARRLHAPKAPGEVAEILPSFVGGGSAGRESLNPVVEERAAEKAAKLEAAGGGHLFVWVRNSAAEAELAMATQPPPESAPTLPAGVDVVWVARAATVPGTDFDRLWRVERGGAWEVMSADGV